MILHSTVIFVADIAKSVQFYTSVMGLQVCNDMGKNIELSNGITLWESTPNHFIPTRLNIPTPTNRFELYFETPNIESEYNRIKELGVEFFHHLHPEPWGQLTFRIYDPDKHLIEVGESMKLTIKTMFDSGMSIDEISKKTGFSQDEINKY